MEKEFLYSRGFYITNASINIPFYNDEFWSIVDIGSSYKVYIHKKQKCHCKMRRETTLFLLGHAYHPIEMIFEENIIVEKLLSYEQIKEKIDFINGLTGVFLIGWIQNNSVTLIGDASCIQCATYGIHDGFVHIASHTHMIEDVCGIQQSTYVKRLVKYRFYHLFGKTLPGDISPYDGFKRLIPNHMVEIGENIKVQRFFPTTEYKEYTAEEQIVAIQKISELLHNNLLLISQKWEKPAISMTGGCDSKTTLACAKGLYEKFLYFSYISSEAEQVDADAARRICRNLGLKHKIYYIPENDNEFPEIECVRAILNRNDGCIGKSNANDVRKRAFFSKVDDFDIEVKSWVSECGRAYYNKRFLKKKFPKKPTPRYLTCLYKVFITDRRLVKKTDQIFQEYMDKYLLTDSYDYPWQELFFWEFRVSSWKGLVITGEHKYSYDITIPYNNRLIIDMLLRFPVNDRINDIAHKRIRIMMNKAIDETGISVTNIKHTNNRAKMERLYLEIMSRVPF